jgi:hypothetical protein
MGRKAKIVLGAIALVGVLVGVWFVLSKRTESAFVQKYRVYNELAAAHVNAAYIPAAGENPLRQELDSSLAHVLVDTALNNAERRTLAQHGIELANQIELEIDDIGTKGADVDRAILDLEAENTLAATGAIGEVIELAKRRAAIINDIRGLSYRANYETTKIFQRVIDDDGTLTEEHVLALNRAVPEVEEQFDKRAGLYQELQEISDKIDHTVKEMAGE